MADEQHAKPSFKHAVAKKALAPVVASIATAATTYLTKKGLELWQEKLQPKLEEQGGVEALAQRAAEALKSKVPSATAGDESPPPPQPDPEPSSSSKSDRGAERQQREERRQQRRRALEQAGSS